MAALRQKIGVYGIIPDDLGDTPPGAVQLSPTIPGAERLEAVAEGSLAHLVMRAPPGTMERRYALALGLRALEAGGTLVALAPKAKGGARIASEIKGFGCPFEESARRHHRICTVRRPRRIEGLEEAIETGGPRFVEALGLWSQPGIFSWDRLDPGSALLVEHLPPLAGRGADLGCGLGVLSRAALRSEGVTHLVAADIDGRALDAARRNVGDRRAEFRWLDLRREAIGGDLDFVLLNAPFHADGGIEEQDLGKVFLRRAAEASRKGGTAFVVANRHLPYEAALGEAFRSVRLVAERDGFKLFEARR